MFLRISCNFLIFLFGVVFVCVCTQLSHFSCLLSVLRCRVRDAIARCITRRFLNSIRAENVQYACLSERVSERCKFWAIKGVANTFPIWNSMGVRACIEVSISFHAYAYTIQTFNFKFALSTHNFVHYLCKTIFSLWQGLRHAVEEEELLWFCVLLLGFLCVWFNIWFIELETLRIRLWLQLIKVSAWTGLDYKGGPL